MKTVRRRLRIQHTKQLVQRTFLTCLLLIGFLNVGCKPKEDYSTYESTNKYIRATYSADVMKPDGSGIHKVEYYPSSPEKWLLVYFKSNTSKGYTHQNFPSEQWESWKASSDPYKWYKRNIKGRTYYRFEPKK